MTTHPETVEQLSERIDALEKRVSLLEHQSPPVLPGAAAGIVQPLQIVPSETAQAGSSLTVIGKALLGIAGAYLLRALSFSGAAPRNVISAVAIAYAIAWLVLAVRTSERSRFTGILYAITSGLIFAPMLWEMCLRFEAMPPEVAVLAVAAYVAVIAVFAARSQDAAAIPVAYAGAALTAAALSIATRAMAPFTAVLLAMVLLGEVARICRRTYPVSGLIFLAADVDVWALIFIYRAPAETRPEYPALGPVLVLAAPVLLFAIHIAGLVFHTLSRRRHIAILDGLQAMIAFSLLACALIWLAPRFSHLALGILCLALSGACYWLIRDAFRDAGDRRNERILGVWGLCLLFCGLILTVPLPTAALSLAAAASAAIFAARRLHYSVLEWHGILLLTAAAFASGMLQYASHCLVGQMPSHPDIAVVGVSALAVLTYALHADRDSDDLLQELVPLAAVLVGTFAVSALLIHLLSGLLVLALVSNAFHIALIRTTALCVLALALALGGARLHRKAMSRAAYVLVAFVTAKLLFEDLRHGNLAFAAASICMVAITFILVPRIAGRSRQSGAAPQSAR